MLDTVGGSANCLAPGVQVGEYRLLDVIGEGGFGIVYRARDVSLDRIVAIKEYMPATLAGRKSSNEIHIRSQHRGAFDAGLRSFINEARLLAKFSHPALVHVYRFFEFNGTAYMVMRHYEGQTFRAFLTAQHDRMNQRMLAAIVGPILDVVEMLHAADCYHRDIAPDNVFLQNSGMPVLLDFGAARRIIGDMTQALTMVLKPGFAPIEQYVDDGAMPQGAWTDIYQIGAMLYLAITGKPPATSVARMINDPVAALSTAAYPGYSAQFLHGVDRALAVKPQERPQTIAELKELLGITTFTMPMVASWAGPAEPAATATVSSVARTHITPDTVTPVQSTRIDASANTTTAASTGPVGLNLDGISSVGSSIVPDPAPANPAHAIGSAMPWLPTQAGTDADGVLLPSQTQSVNRSTVARLQPVEQLAEPSIAPSEAPAAHPTPTAPPLSGQAHGKAPAGGATPPTSFRVSPMRWAAVAVALAAATALTVWWGVQGGATNLPNAEAALNLDDQRWKEAQTAGTVAALDAYLNSHPAGKHRSEAMDLINRMEVQEPAVARPQASASAEVVAAANATPERSASPGAMSTPAPTLPAVPAPPPVAAKAEAPAAVTAAATAEPVAPKVPAKPVGDVGRVVLRISPWGRISVNGNTLGTTPPLTHIELPEGSHRIEVSNPAASPVIKTVQVKKGEPVVISHQFE
ncbi:protein kinase [Acidovorax sp. LjRoot129]|uniref:protein kinase domain-containing protein n=1 Tax=Acidovorax sp. LjRoot129 TaxID=3342260 RepID=UPI003ECE70E6